jgi:hypothetical protein
LTRQLPFPSDPDFVLRMLERILYGVGFDATLLAVRDPELVLKNRRKMMGLLARHFRIPPSYWEDREIVEMERWLRDLTELAAEEHPTADLT